MSNLLEMFGIVSDPVKIAWVLWIGWGVAQIGWYRRTRQHAAELRAAVAASSAGHAARNASGVRRSAVSHRPLPVSTMERPAWETTESGRGQKDH